MLNHLKSILSPENIQTNPDQLENYSHDETSISPQQYLNWQTSI